MTTRQQSMTDGVCSADARKLFTLDEANRALPYVSRVVDDVVAVYAEIVSLRRRLEDLGEGDQTFEMERDYERSMDRLGALVDELHLVGVELKDFGKGLIDFPARAQGREVVLCWKPGESQVAHWHESDAGFAERRPVGMLQD